MADPLTLTTVVDERADMARIRFSCRTCDLRGVAEIRPARTAEHLADTITHAHTRQNRSESESL